MQTIIEKANQEALEIIQNGQPTLIVLESPRRLSRYGEDLFLHAGPPISWEECPVRYAEA